jgi:hypothetical protein
MLKVENIKKDYTLEKCADQGRFHKAPVIVFTPDRSRPGPKNIMADMQWRREHDAPFSEEELLEVLKPTFEELKFDVQRITYDHYAGCAMCPCSPGYCCYGILHEKVYGKRVAIWLEDEV